MGIPKIFNIFSTKNGNSQFFAIFDINKMVREPNVSPHKQNIKDDDVKECISIE